MEGRNLISRRDVLRNLGATFFWTLSVSKAALAKQACPLCGGTLSLVGTYRDSRSRPSPNEAVWSRASDSVGCEGLWDPPTSASRQSCVPEFTPKSLFCTHCYHAFSERDQCWRRELGSTDFVRPLSPSILGFPLPERKYILYGVGYFQTFGGWSGTDYRLDEINFWVRADTPKPFMDAISDYANTHQLKLAIKPPNESGVYVHVMYVEGHPPEDFDFPDFYIPSTLLRNGKLPEQTVRRAEL